MQSRKGIAQQLQKQVNKLDSVEAVEKEMARVGTRLKRVKNETDSLEIMKSLLTARRNKLMTLALPAGSEVVLRAIPLIGQGAELGGKAGILLEKKRKYATVDFGDLGKWYIPMENLASADDKPVNPNLAKMFPKLGRAFGQALEDMKKEGKFGL